MENQNSQPTPGNNLPDAVDLNRYLLASASTREINLSDKLWRYLTFEKFMWLLETSKLWHARLDQLGDPFEGSYPTGYVQMRDAGQLPSYLQRGIPAEMEKEINRADIYNHFATCWYASERESAAMWMSYSTMHGGVAVVTTPNRMHKSVNLAPYGNGILSPVQYEDFSTFDTLLRPITKSFGRKAYAGLLKRKSFEHENEVRGLIHWNNFSKIPSSFLESAMAETFRNANPVGIAVTVDLHDLIEEIYVSPLAQPYFREVVQCVAKRHGFSDRLKVSSLCGEPLY